MKRRRERKKYLEIHILSLHSSSPRYLHLPLVSCRDSFGNVLDLLDDLFERASLADVRALVLSMPKTDENVDSLSFISS